MSDGAGTRAVHAGLPAPEQGAPFLPGPVLAAPTHLTGDADPAGYGRYANPTWARTHDAKPLALWEPSQNGLRVEAPQRHSAIGPSSTVQRRPSTSSITTGPVTL